MLTYYVLILEGYMIYNHKKSFGNVPGAMCCKCPMGVTFVTLPVLEVLQSDTMMKCQNEKNLSNRPEKNQR